MLCYGFAGGCYARGISKRKVPLRSKRFAWRNGNLARTSFIMKPKGFLVCNKLFSIFSHVVPVEVAKSMVKLRENSLYVKDLATIGSSAV